MNALSLSEIPQRMIEVAVSGMAHSPDHGVLTYAVPDDWDAPLEPGSLVWVPVRQRIELGIVSAETDSIPEFEVKTLHAPVKPAIALTAWQMETARWMARETASSLYATASLFLPPGMQHRQIEVLHADPDIDLSDFALTAAQSQLMTLLREKGPMTLDAARTATGRKLDTVVSRLIDLGVLRQELRVDQHTPQQQMTQLVRLLSDDADLPGRSVKQRRVQDILIARRRLLRDDDSEWTTVDALRERVVADSTTLNGMVKKGIIELSEVPRFQAPQPRSAAPPVMTAQQAAVWSNVERSLASRDHTPILLFGVTGGGKTEIYLRGVSWCLRFGRGAIILLPEIALATQVVRRFIDRFPGKVAVLHSQMNASQRYATWKSIERGEFQIVVGPRSALFAPVRDLGLIVLDEEHESTYKQDSEPRYHARTVAGFLARQQRATVLLGSATPAIESWYRADLGIYRRLELSERVSPSRIDTVLELPPVEIVDLRQELHQANTSLLSRRLQEVIAAAHRRGEQSILLLNRRGQSTIVICRSCGHRLICPHCEIPLVFHRDRGLLICHRCDHRERPPKSCPQCLGRLDFFGAGTQRVEEETRQLFPDVRVLRWDQDSVRQQGGYESMLGRVEAGEVDIIIGTQMVAKGFDLPKVTVVGVIQADTMLHLPDFRSPERTFQLVTQVAGRAGRRAPGSRVIVQTYTPGHYAIQTASRHDYRAFYEEESAFRQHFVYPPFARLVRCVFKHKQERAAAVEAEMMARAMARHAKWTGVKIDLLGPTPAFAAKVRGMYQWQIIVRGHDLDPFLDGLPIRPGWVIDVDPQSML